MARSPVEGLQNEIKFLLKQNTKGMSIEEISTELSISRTTATKYLNALEQTGQVESRPYGPAKIFTIAERISIENFVSVLPHLILILDEDLTIKQVNESLLDFFHLEKSSLIGREIQYSFLGSYIDEPWLELIRQAVHGIPQSIEEDLTFEENRYNFLVRIIPTIFEKGEKGAVIIFEDVTTLKDYQEHLEEIVIERTAELNETNAQLHKEIQKRQVICDQFKASQDKYQQVIDSSTDIILKFSAENILILHNKMAEEILGIFLSKQKNYHLLGTCIPNKKQYHEYAHSLISELISDPTLIRRAEFEYSSSETLWISWTFHCITSLTSGKPEILCIGTDISDRIITEKRLKESETQMALILAHLPDPTFVLNSERKVVIWNQAMEEMTGVPAEQVIGKERVYFTPSIFGFARPVLADLIFEPDNENIKKYFQDLSFDGEVLTAETKGIAKDGTELLFWVKVTPVKDEKDNIIAAIQSLRDITSQQKIEAELVESESRARGILDTSKDLIIVFDKNARVVFSNSAYNQITGQNESSLKGKSIENAFLPGDVEEWKRIINSVIRTRLGNRIEIQALIDDREVILDCYIIPFILERSEELHIQIDMRDITAMKTKGAPLWDEEGTLQEIGRHISKIIPRIDFRQNLTPLALIAIVLFFHTEFLPTYTYFHEIL